MLLWLTAPLFGQNEGGVQTLEARVTAIVGSEVHLDRGAASAILPGDPVRILPLGGTTLSGRVIAVDERSCQVELDGDPSGILPGTPAEIDLPVDREPTPSAQPEHPAWSNPEGPWDSDVPLLAKVTPPSPEERESHWSGRWSNFAEWTDDGRFGDTFLFARSGLDLRGRNPWGRGGEFQLDVEYGVERSDTPDGQGSTDAFLRIDRLSYAWGGDRERPRRFEVGRFLQKDVPEFGVLDGVQMIERLPNGDRYGASVGFLPEPNESFSSGSDFQTSAFYRHTRGEHEELSMTGGYQKTWHGGRADRDLLLGNVRWYPRSEWNAWAGAWIDLYGSEDTAKGSGPELTQFIAGLGRRIGTDAGLNLSLSRFRIPQLLRNEFSDVTEQELANDRSDRVSLSGWRQVTSDLRLSARLDRWNDETASGTGVELRADARDLFLDRSRSSLALFTQEGRFSDVVGCRFSFGAPASVGSWRVDFDLGQHTNHDFFGDQEVLNQDRLRVRWDMRTAGGWDLSIHAERRFGDEQDTTVIGFYLQRGF